MLVQDRFPTAITHRRDNRFASACHRNGHGVPFSLLWQFTPSVYVRRLAQCFLLHCAGIVVPELLDGTNHVAWFRAGETIFEPSGINYLGVPGLINAHNIIATLIVQVDLIRQYLIYHLLRQLTLL